MPPEENKNRVPIKSLRTYQGDVEEAIGKNKESSTTIFVAEQKRKIEQPEKVTQVSYSPARNRLFVYMGGMLFAIGLISVVAVYYIRSSEKTVIEQQTKTLLSFSKELELQVASTSRDSFLSKIKEQKDIFKMPINSILYINTLSGTSQEKVENILSLIGPSQPGTLTRSFDSNYMLGIYSYDTNEVFLIIKVKDFASSYSGMLKWEKDMPKDLAKIFSLSPEILNSQTIFTDEALRNKDLRILKDFNGKTQLLYSFVDKETLVITKNEGIFSAIIGRLAISKQAK